MNMCVCIYIYILITIIIIFCDFIFRMDVTWNPDDYSIEDLVVFLSEKVFLVY